MPFEFKKLDIPEVVLIIPRAIKDERGFFVETFRRSQWEAAGIPTEFAQENHSRSRSGTLRGLHYQRAPHAQGKLVRAIRGEIFDVAVDVRPNSPTRGKWVCATLSESNLHMLFVPGWCAHGFCILSDFAEVVYKTSAEYAPEYEGGVRWNDPAINVSWPVDDPILSERDARWPLL